MSSEDRPDEVEPEVSWDEVTKECAILRCLIRRVSEHRRAAAAVHMIVDMAINAGCCYICSRAILEEARLQLEEVHHESVSGDDGEEE